MGTSLSGLTPATTFDGLLKVGDNDPLTATLKPISTGDGTDTMLELSTSALQIGGATGMYWDNTNKRLGIGTNAPSTPFEVYGGVRFRNNLNLNGNIFNSTSGIVNIDGLAYFNGITDKVGIGESTPTSRLHIKGSGATSATTSLLVQNSGNNNIISTTDDRSVLINNQISVQHTGFGQWLRVLAAGVTSNVSLYGYGIGDGSHNWQTKSNYSGSNFRQFNTGFSFGAGALPPDTASTLMTIKGSGNDATTTSLLVQNSDASASLTYDDSGKVEIVGNSQTGFIQTYGFGAVGFGNESGPTILYGKAGGGVLYAGLHTGSGYTAFGANSSSSQRVLIKGSGATSATTALLVQNSANNIFSVRDDGALLFYRATNGAELLRIEDTGSSPRFVAGNNAGKSLTLGNDTITSAFSSIQFKTYDGTAYSEAMRITGNTDQFIGIGEPTPTARLHVKAGTTQDSIAKFEDPRATTDYIEIKNDSTLTDYTGLYWGTSVKIRSKQTGAIFLDCTSGILFANGNSSKNKIDGDGNMSIGTPTIPASTRMTIKGQGATSATTSLLVQNSAGTEHLKITDDGTINARSSITLNHATNSSRSLRLSWGSLYATDNAAELNIGAVYSQPTAPRIILGGKTRSGGADAVLVQALNGMYLSTTANTENPSAQLHVKGSGATSATTALLVENSSGTDTLEVRDDGRVVAGTGATTNANGTFNVLHGTSNLTTRVFTVSRDSVLRGMDINSGGSTKISDSSGDQSFSHTATAVFEVSSTTQGFLPPRMTGTQRDAIESPASGLIIYNTTTNKAQCYNGTSWNDMF